MKSKYYLLLLMVISTTLKAIDPIQLSFEEVMESKIMGHKSAVLLATYITWKNIALRNKNFTALTGKEVQEYSVNEQRIILQERAEQLCQWAGMAEAIQYKIDDQHVILRPQIWYKLDESINPVHYPRWEDLEQVNIRPNYREVIHTEDTPMCKMLKICTSTTEYIRIRPNGPTSFSQITCR